MGHIKIVHTDLLPPKVFRKFLKGFWFCYCHCLYKLIYWIQGNHLNFSWWFSFKFVSAVEDAIQKLGHWFVNIIIILYIFLKVYCYQDFLDRNRRKIKGKKGLVDNAWWWNFNGFKLLFKFGPRVTKAQWVNLSQFFAVPTHWLNVHTNTLIYKHHYHMGHNFGGILLLQFSWQIHV